MSRSTRRGALATASAVLASVSLIVLPSTSAFASTTEDPPVVVPTVFAEQQQFLYGQGWSLAFDGGYVFASSVDPAALTVELEGFPKGYIAHQYSQGQFGGTMSGFVYPDYEQPPLDAGSYTVKLSGKATAWDGTKYSNFVTNAQSTLTIGKIALGAESRVLPDPSNPTVSIISATLTGEFVDQYYPSSEKSVAGSPAGTWTFTVLDSAGSEVYTTTVDRSEGDHVLGASVVWDGAEPGEEYVAVVTFAPGGGSEKNFTVSAPKDFEFTASTSSRVIAASEAGESVRTQAPPEPDFSVPLWWVILIAMALVALIACAVVFSIRLGARTTNAQK